MTTYAFDCPSGLKYDQEASQCEYSSNVPECGGSRPTTPTPVAPPQPGQQVGEQRPNSGSPQPQPFTGQHPQQPSNTFFFKDNTCLFSEQSLRATSQWLIRASLQRLLFLLQ